MINDSEKTLWNTLSTTNDSDKTLWNTHMRRLYGTHSVLHGRDLLMPVALGSSGWVFNQTFGKQWVFMDQLVFNDLTRSHMVIFSLPSTNI